MVSQPDYSPMSFRLGVGGCGAMVATGPYGQPNTCRLPATRCGLLLRRPKNKPAEAWLVFACVVSKRRRVLFNVIEYAVERELLAVNPLPGLKWKPPNASGGVDKRSVVNPIQARTLLAAVHETKRSGPQLVAFFALMYFAALRPEEAANVHKHNLSLPEKGWGEIHLEEATPHAGSSWTDDGRQRDQRQLKNRASRTVPCPPELTAILHAHIAEFGTGASGRACSSVSARRRWQS